MNWNLRSPIKLRSTHKLEEPIVTSQPRTPRSHRIVQTDLPYSGAPSSSENFTGVSQVKFNPNIVPSSSPQFSDNRPEMANAGATASPAGDQTAVKLVSRSERESSDAGRESDHDSDLDPGDRQMPEIGLQGPHPGLDQGLATPPSDMDDLRRQLRKAQDTLADRTRTLDALRQRMSDKEDEVRNNAHQFATVMDGYDLLKVKMNREIKRVGECNGLDANKTLTWVRKVSESPNALQVARATAEGALAKTLNNHNDWPSAKTAILTKHVSPIFPLRQKEKLMRHKQGKDTWLAYDEEFGNLYREAYPNPNQAPQEELIRVYTNGLTNESMAYEILKQNPQTVTEMRDLASKQQKYAAMMGNSQKTHLSTEVKLAGEIQTLTKGIESLVQTQKDFEKKLSETETAAPITKPRAQPRNNQRGKASGSSQPPRNIVCYRCGQQGHVARNCRAPTSKPDVPKPRQNWQQLPPPQHYPKKGAANSQPQGQPQQQQTAVVDNKCYRCRQPGHTVKGCTAAPPQRRCYCGEPHWYYDCPQRQQQQSQNQSN